MQEIAREISSKFFDRVSARVTREFLLYNKGKAVDMNKVKEALDEVDDLIDIYHDYSKDNQKINVRVLISLIEAKNALNGFLQHKRNIESLEAVIRNLSMHLSDL